MTDTHFTLSEKLRLTALMPRVAGTDALIGAEAGVSPGDRS